MAIVQYHGRLGKIYGIWLRNLLLTIVTLGIYSFWGRRRMRQYLASQVTLNGDPMEYKGTVKEHVLGALKFVGLILALHMVFEAVFPQPDIETMKNWQQTSPQLLLEDTEFKASLSNQFIYWTVENIFYVFVIGVFVFTSRCYRINRVSWQGIYHRLDGSMWQYAWLRFYTLCGKFFSAGFFAPSLDAKLAKYTYSRLWFGNTNVNLLPYTPSKYLHRINVKTILIILILTIPAFVFFILLYMVLIKMSNETQYNLLFFIVMQNINALIIVYSFLAYAIIFPFVCFIRLYYHAAFYREFLSHITVAGVLVDSSRITSGRLISLLIGNVVLQVFTLGLAQPIVIDRSLRWLTENIKFDGELANDIGSSPRLSLSSEMPPFLIA